MLSDKGQSSSKITLIENDTIISNDKEVAETLNGYFVSITDSLGLTENSEVISSTEGVSDPIDSAIIKYSNHPSIRKIRNFAQNDDSFKFQKVSLEQMHTEIGRLNPKKVTTFKNIPAKVLKSSSKICSESMQLIFNDCVQNGLFPDLLKLADVTPLHKKEEKTRKKHYRPVNVLPTVSRVFERLLDKQIIDYMGLYLSSLLCGFRKGYNAQHALVQMLEKWKTSLDNGANIGAILMDLTKAFDCIKHDLLLAKLSAYGFSREALRLVNSSLENRHQRVKINGSFSVYKKNCLLVFHKARFLVPCSLTST